MMCDDWFGHHSVSSKNKQTSSRPTVIVDALSLQSLRLHSLLEGNKGTNPPFVRQKNHPWPVSGLSSQWALSYWKSNISNITGHQEAFLLLQPFILSPSSYLILPSQVFLPHPIPAISWQYDSTSFTILPKLQRLLSTVKLNGSNMNRALTVDKELLLIDSPPPHSSLGRPPSNLPLGGGRIVWSPSLLMSVLTWVCCSSLGIAEPRSPRSPLHIDPLCLRRW